MKLLIDMNLSPSWVEFFAASGIESIHWSKVGDPAASDGVIMEYAAGNGFVIFTHDLDFGPACRSEIPSAERDPDPHAGRSPTGDWRDCGARAECEPVAA
jgi:hypothetical protein